MKEFKVFLCAIPAFLGAAFVSDWLNAPWLFFVSMAAILIGAYRAIYRRP